MDLGLAGKVAVVTGGSRGIGFAAAKALAGEGAQAVLVARDPDRLERACAELAAAGSGTAWAVPADLSQPGGEREAVERILARHGRIDVLVNSAGSALGGDFCALSEEDWQHSLALKFHGSVRMMRAVVPAMRAQGGGRIVNVVGSAGRQPEARQLPVAAANAALLAVTRGLADELGPDGIVVVAVNPGVTRTERFDRRMKRLAAASGRDEEEVRRAFEAELIAHTPLGRLGEAEDLGQWIAFLASGRARHFTGGSITVDGGFNRVPG